MTGRLALIMPMLVLALSGCDSYHYHSARFFDATQRYGRAVEQYEAFLAFQTSGPRVVEAHLRAGDIYAHSFKRCLEASRHFEAAARMTKLGSVPYETAEQGLMECPDYFPLEAGRRWVYGDSESRGHAMRLEWAVELASAGERAISGELFAGPRRVRNVLSRYEKRDWMVWEIADGKRRPILRYPFKAGQFWKAGNGRQEERFAIEQEGIPVETAVGVFTGCLKVRDTLASAPQSWTYRYYAPYVGLVKTTLAGPGYEHPNTELIMIK